LYTTASESFNALKSVSGPVLLLSTSDISRRTVDCAVLEEINKTAQEILPGLRAEYEQVMRELEQEEAEVAELHNYNQDFQKELKASIAEQKYFISLCFVVCRFADTSDTAPIWRLSKPSY
jgi:hypothetical protein